MAEGASSWQSSVDERLRASFILHRRSPHWEIWRGSLLLYYVSYRIRRGSRSSRGGFSCYLWFLGNGSSMDGGILTLSLVNTNAGDAEVNRGHDKNQKRPLTESKMRRKGLTDITNMCNTVGLEVNETGCTSQSDGIKTNQKLMSSPRPKDCITELVKLYFLENTTLLKLIAERNEILRLSSIELQKCNIRLQKLELQLQKTNQQNLQLARTNSQLLGDLILGKDTLKRLQHELSCTRAALTLKTSELEEGPTNHGDVTAGACDTTMPKKTCNPNRKCKSKPRSLDSPSLAHQVSLEEKEDGRW